MFHSSEVVGVWGVGGPVSPHSRGDDPGVVIAKRRSWMVSEASCRRMEGLCPKDTSFPLIVFFLSL